MDLIKNLKQLKNIEADRAFTERSRNLILGPERGAAVGFWNIVLKNVEVGASLALAGLLIFMILGGFSALKFLSPLRQLTAIDPISLRAEADAINIQIQLTGLDYEEGGPETKLNKSTPAFAPDSDTETKTSEEQEVVSEEPADDSPLKLSIDEALQILSEWNWYTGKDNHA